MDLNEKLNRIISILDCSNTALAHVSEIDPSYISRLRRGTRVPRAESSQFKKLCRGIAVFASDNMLVEKLIEVCALDGKLSFEEEITNYLINKPKKKKEVKNKRAGRKGNYKFFGQKLNALMNMLDITNIRLAKALSVDSSLISRFRNGMRTPPANNQFIQNLCAYFCKKAAEQDMTSDLAELLCIPTQYSINNEEFLSFFVEWICGKPDSKSSQTMDDFLEKFSMGFYKNASSVIPLESIINDEILNDSKKVYIGIKGFRKAVIRMLCAVAVSEKPCTLKLYSDQNIEWLTSDPEFALQWSSLMYICLNKNNSMYIIHNIERCSEEMFMAIEKWIPFYMTGKLRSFYCSSSGNGIFANTIFIASGVSCLSANIIIGTEDSGRYFYSDLPDDISYIDSQFTSLKHMSKPLVHIFNNDYISEYLLFFNDMAKKPGVTKYLLTSLSLETMPKSLLVKMLIANGITGLEAEQILLLYDYRKHKFATELISGGITEYVPVCDISELLSDECRISLADLFMDKQLKYTPEHYISHLQSVVSFLTEHENYRIIPLKEKVYKNVQMAVKENAGSFVLKADMSPAAYWFDNPLMCTSFSKYIDTAGCNLSIELDGNNMIQWLVTYISEIEKAVSKSDACEAVPL